MMRYVIRWILVLLPSFTILNGLFFYTLNGGKISPTTNIALLGSIPVLTVLADYFGQRWAAKNEVNCIAESTT